MPLTRSRSFFDHLEPVLVDSASNGIRARTPGAGLVTNAADSEPSLRTITDRR